MTQSKTRRRMFLTTGSILISILSSSMAANTAENNTGRPDRGRVIYNLDSTEFFVNTFGPVVPESIDKFVDSHAAAGITDLFVNVNAQRTNYQSDVWESCWDGYDPARGNEQPFFAGIEPHRMFEADLFKRMHGLHKQGCDYPERILKRARQNGIGAWLSLRMNDSHHPTRPDHPFHSTFWKSHPQWRLSNGGLDYERPEVREHYLKLIREVCGRYDLDGLELDFLRFWLYFRPRREHTGAKLMSDLLQQARSATREAEKRLGHPVQLAVRVPGTPWIARRHGLDAVAWAQAGLVDLIVAGSFWFSVNSDIPVETWKGMLTGTDVKVAVHLEDGINSGASGRRTMTHEEMRGVLVSGLHRGADAVYFFNLFTGPYHDWPREDHDRLITDAGSYAALRAAPRRHPLTIVSPWARGEPGAFVDHEYTRGKLVAMGSAGLPSVGKQSHFRLHTGPPPLPHQKMQIEMVVSGYDQPLEVRLNDIPCRWSEWVEPEHITAAGWKQPGLGKRQVYTVPADAVADGYNVIEATAPQEVTIQWVEIAVSGVEHPTSQGDR